MGVHGLWKLLEPAGKPVPLESLENKVLAVDVSIWLHQLVKGFQDSRGSSLPNAHLLGLFHRVCKLLYYRIKPVFVFDGGVPVLKRQTIAARRQQKNRAAYDAERIREQLLKTLIKSKAVRRVLGEKTSREDVSEDHPREDADMFKLPPVLEELESDSESEEANPIKTQRVYDSDSDSDVKVSPLKMRGLNLDLHTLDVTSEQFLSLPPDVRHDILSELQETRKQNSWGRLHEMPEESGEFSSFQVGRLLKRRNVQVSLEQAEKEMGGKVLSLNELQELMSAQGVEIPEEPAKVMDWAARRIASDTATRYLLVTESSKRDEKTFIRNEPKTDTNSHSRIKPEIKTELVDKNIPPELLDNWSSDEEALPIREAETKARDFMLENSDLSQEQILAIIQSQNKDKDSSSRHASEPTRSAAVLSSVDSFGDKGLSKTTGISETQDVASISDSDSDDFMEVHSNNLSSLKPSTGKQGTLEIIVPTEKVIKVEDDIFADIFSKPEVAKDSEKIIKAVSCAMNVESLVDRSDRTSSVSSRFSQGNPANRVTPSSKEKDTRSQIVHVAQDPRSQNTAESSHKGSGEQLESHFQVMSGESCTDDAEVRGVIDLEQRCYEGNISSEEMSVTPRELEPAKSVENDEMYNNPNESVSSSEEQYTLPKKPENELSTNMSMQDLQKLEASLDEHQHNLEAERGRQERLAASITEQMCTEAQELLRLFGLPYIVAPMEAEAQCAFLDAISLTEGTITDDSDIWLFGGRKVYKNFFNQKKHVLQYTASNIQHYFKMTRQQMVQLALLVGSDYTAGLQGVGPVTALEILAAFPCDAEGSSNESIVRGLRRFRDWWMAGRPQRSARTQQLKTKVKDIKFVDGFPSLAVVDAYLKPAVDDSNETFSWGALDVAALRDYTRIKFGWTAAKVDEILLPVAKRWTDRSSQRMIDSYFNVKPMLVEGQSKMSKRVKKAVTLMDNGGTESDDVDDPMPASSLSDATKQKICVKMNKKQAASSRTQMKKGKKEACAEMNPAEKGERRVKLLVRAPTVPRQRSSTGVKRVGAKQHKPASAVESDDTAEERIGIELPVPFPVLNQGNSAMKKGVEANQSQKESANVCLLGEEDKRVDRSSEDEVESQGYQQKKSVGWKEHTVEDGASKSVVRSRGTRNTAIKKKHPTQTENLAEQVSETVRRSEVGEPQPGVSGLKRTLSATASKAKQPRIKDSSSSEDEHANELLADELAALNDVEWQDDPWEDELMDEMNEFSYMKSMPQDKREQKPRHKRYFGGIRRNKPSKRSNPNPAPPPQAQPGMDERGLRPGWRTEERLQSRNAQWPDASRNTAIGRIPQREKDQAAQEQAKMKAIQVLKASGSLQSMRILGTSTKSSRRGRGRAKPVRKELAEHNLSESSSDD